MRRVCGGFTSFHRLAQELSQDHRRGYTKEMMLNGLVQLVYLAPAIATLSILPGNYTLPNRSATLSEVPPVALFGPCAPPSNASAAAGTSGYRRFFANDSFIGQPVRCTRDERICFHYNLVFDPRSDRCQPIGGDYRGDCDLRVNRTEFRNGTGRVIGACKSYTDPCPGLRMAYDNRCYRTETVRDVICGCAAHATRHFLGGAECRSSPARPINVQQPTEEGRCLIPDLRFPDTERSVFYNKTEYELLRYVSYKSRVFSPHLLCVPQQATCLAKKTVWISGGCYRLLGRGPCKKHHIVAINGEAMLQGRVDAVCVHVRGGCPRGQRRMAFDGQCHDDRVWEIVPPVPLSLNIYGQYITVKPGYTLTYKLDKVVGNICHFGMAGIAGPAAAAAYPKPPCGGSDANLCWLYQVEAEPPLPE